MKIADTVYLLSDAKETEVASMQGDSLAMDVNLLARQLERVGHPAAGEFAIQRDLLEAHAEGLHDDVPREGCPECDDRIHRCGP